MSLRVPFSLVGAIVWALSTTGCAGESDEYWGGTVGGYETPNLVTEGLGSDEEQRILLDIAGRITNRGPFDYPEDGDVYDNEAGLLPTQPKGYYRVYTVPTPKARDRGRRRLVAGEAGELYYSRDNLRRLQALETRPREER